MTARGFIMLPSYYEALHTLDDEMRLQMYDSIFAYVFEGKEPEGLNPILQGFFALMRPNIDNSIRNYASKVENGKQGGRPKKTERKPNQNLSETESKANKTERKPNGNLDKEKDIDKDSDKEEEIDSEIKKDIYNYDDEIPLHYIDTIERYVIEDILGDKISSIGKEELISFKADLPDDVIRHAADRAIDHGARNWAYIKSILNGYCERGVKSLADAISADEQFDRSRKGGSNRGGQKAVDRRQYDRAPTRVTPHETIF